MKKMTMIMMVVLVALTTACTQPEQTMVTPTSPISDGIYTYQDPAGEFTAAFTFDGTDVDFNTQMGADEGFNLYEYEGTYTVINDTFEMNIDVNNGVLTDIKYAISIGTNSITMTDIEYPINVRTYIK